MILIHKVIIFHSQVLQAFGPQKHISPQNSWLVEEGVVVKKFTNQDGVGTDNQDRQQP